MSNRRFTYQNKQAARTARAVIRSLYALLLIGIVFSLLGVDGISPTWLNCCIAGLIFTFVVSCLGGLHELNISADSDGLDVCSEPIMSEKTQSKKQKTYTLGSDRIIDFCHIQVPPFHVVCLTYNGHNGHKKKMTMGLTLMSSSKRNEFLKLLRFLKRHSSHAAHDTAHHREKQSNERNS